MEVLLSLVKDNIFIIVGALVLLYAIISFIKSLIRWVLALVFIVGVSLYIYDPSFSMFNSEIVTAEKEALKQEVVSKLLANTNNVKYQEGKNGSYTLTAADSVIYGTYLSKTATIVANGKEVTVEVTPAIKEFIQKFKGEHQKKVDAMNNNPTQNDQ